MSTLNEHDEEKSQGENTTKIQVINQKEGKVIRLPTTQSTMRQNNEDLNALKAGKDNNDLDKEEKQDQEYDIFMNEDFGELCGYIFKNATQNMRKLDDLLYEYYKADQPKKGQFCNQLKEQFFSFKALEERYLRLQPENQKNDINYNFYIMYCYESSYLYSKKSSFTRFVFDVLKKNDSQFDVLIILNIWKGLSVNEFMEGNILHFDTIQKLKNTLNESSLQDDLKKCYLSIISEVYKFEKNEI